MFKPTPEQIDKMVDFWAEQITAPTFNNLSDAEIAAGENPLATALATVMHQNRGGPTPEEVNRFKECLRKRLDPKTREYVIQRLHSDYGPDVYLFEAAKEAGIPGVIFPWKTNSWFCDDGKHIKVSVGYGRPVEVR